MDAREVILTDSQFQKAIPLDAAIEKRANEKVRPLVNEGKVPVMGGFVGSNEAGITTTLGRGGSDFTGALIGGALAADSIEIWTDVDGIMTSDPRVCPDALRVKVISFEEAAELAYFGAKVLHLATIPSAKKTMPIHSCSTAGGPATKGRASSRPPRHVFVTAFRAICGLYEAMYCRRCGEPDAHDPRLSQGHLRRVLTGTKCAVEEGLNQRGSWCR